MINLLKSTNRNSLYEHNHIARVIMENKFFTDFDFTDFWDDSDFSQEMFIEEYPDDDLIKSVEQELGYKLPASYIELMKLHNGGCTEKVFYPATGKSAPYVKDYVSIEGIMGIGRTKDYSICGDLGNQFLLGDYIGHYPDTGVYICMCQAGFDVIMLDYSKCGKDGEPEVVHVDKECDYKKTVLAKDFETFIKGLVNGDDIDFEEEEDDIDFEEEEDDIDFEEEE